MAAAARALDKVERELPSVSPRVVDGALAAPEPGTAPVAGYSSRSGPGAARRGSDGGGEIAEGLDQPHGQQASAAADVGPETSREWITAAERDLLTSAQAPRTAELVDGHNANMVYVVRFADGTGGVYKPVDGEQLLPNPGEEAYGLYAPATLADREVAASRLDEMLGFDLVPTTTYWEGHAGVGSLQRFADGHLEGLDVAEYLVKDQERMAVLDYLTNNTDRHDLNYLTSVDHRPVAIDNGQTFHNMLYDPEVRTTTFAGTLAGEPLGTEVMDAVRRIDSGRLRDMLLGVGLDPRAADGAVYRLEQLRDLGMIPPIVRRR